MTLCSTPGTGICTLLATKRLNNQSKNAWSLVMTEVRWPCLGLISIWNGQFCTSMYQQACGQHQSNLLKQTTELIILSGQLLFLNKDVKPERRRAEKGVNVQQQVDVLGLKRDYWSLLHDGVRGCCRSGRRLTNGASDRQLCDRVDQLERAQRQDQNKKQPKG